MNKFNKINILFAITVFLVAIGAFLPTLSNPFIWDDLQLITQPLKIEDNPYNFFFGGGLYYRPLLHLSMATDYSFWRLNPMGYHITNILLHAFNSLLVFFVGFLIIKNKSSAINNTNLSDDRFKSLLTLPFISGIVFALHPIHTESVAWISGRTDMLSTFFFLLAFISYILYVKEGTKASLFLTCVFFLFSLFSKENGIAFIIIALAYGIITKLQRRKITISLVCLTAVLFIYILFRQSGAIKMLLADPGSKGAFFSSGVSSENFLALLSGASGYYFEKLLLPFNLNLLPDMPDAIIYYFISSLPLVIGAFLYFRGRKLEAFFTFWIIITLLPSLVILFSQVSNIIGERYLYLPSVGFSILVGLVMSNITSRKLLLACILSISTVSVVVTYDRLKAWETDLALWEDTVQKSPLSVNAHINYGRALLDNNDIDNGKNELLIALGLRNKGLIQTSKIYELLGTAEMKSKNYAKAESYLITSLKTNPKNATAYNNLGILYLRMSESPDVAGNENTYLNRAIKSLEQSLVISPNFLQPKFNLGLCYLKQRDLDNAEKSFYSVIEADPGGKFCAEASQFLMFIEFMRLKLSK